MVSDHNQGMKIDNLNSNNIWTGFREQVKAYGSDAAGGITSTLKEYGDISIDWTEVNSYLYIVS